jgi:hypothetical protein
MVHYSLNTRASAIGIVTVEVIVKQNNGQTPSSRYIGVRRSILEAQNAEVESVGRVCR